MAKVWRMLELKGVGIETAWCYGMEFFGWRRFANRRQLGSLAGLTPTPHDSGTQEREKGIGRDGSRWVRGVAIEQAWAWLRFQPESALSQWYHSRFGGGSKRHEEDRDRRAGAQAADRAVAIRRVRRAPRGRGPGPPRSARVARPRRSTRTDDRRRQRHRRVPVRTSRTCRQVPERPAR
jgi:transposase